MPGKLVHFEVPADDTGRAVDFYGQLFGWSFQDMKLPVEYHMTQLSEGMAGAIHRADQGGGISTSTTSTRARNVFVTWVGRPKSPALCHRWAGTHDARTRKGTSSASGKTTRLRPPWRPVRSSDGKPSPKRRAASSQIRRRERSKGGYREERGSISTSAISAPETTFTDDRSRRSRW